MRQHTFPAMMFAAGFGTRMKQLTQDQPKPMIPVAGRPLVDHALDMVRDAGCAPVVANLHYKPDTLQTHLTTKGVTCLIETPDILETGGGLRNALGQLGSAPVVTLNTDAVWAGPNPITLLQNAWDPADMDALLMLIPLDHAVGHRGSGDFLMQADGTLTRGAGAIYGGVQIIKTEGLAAIPDRAFSLNVLWNTMLDRRRLFGLQYPGQWCDVGRPEGIALAEEMLESADV